MNDLDITLSVIKWSYSISLWTTLCMYIVETCRACVAVLHSTAATTWTPTASYCVALKPSTFLRRWAATPGLSSKDSARPLRLFLGRVAHYSVSGLFVAVEFRRRSSVCWWRACIVELYGWIDQDAIRSNGSKESCVRWGSALAPPVKYGWTIEHSGWVGLPPGLATRPLPKLLLDFLFSLKFNLFS